MKAAVFSLVLLLGMAPLQSRPDSAAASFAQAWEEKDVGSLRNALAEEGIRLHLPEEEHLLIRPRQAAAALDAFLRRYHDGQAQITRVAQTGGEPGKGYAEVRWITGSSGVAEPVIFTLFVAFAFQDEGWSVTEIRVLF